MVLTRVRSRALRSAARGFSRTLQQPLALSAQSCPGVHLLSWRAARWTACSANPDYVPPSIGRIKSEELVYVPPSTGGSGRRAEQSPPTNATGPNPEYVSPRVGGIRGEEPTASSKGVEEEEDATGGRFLDNAPSIFGRGSGGEVASPLTKASGLNPDYEPPGVSGSAGEEMSAASKPVDEVQTARGPNLDSVRGDGEIRGTELDGASKADEEVKLTKGSNPDYATASFGWDSKREEVSLATKTAASDPAYAPPSVGGSKGEDPIIPSQAVEEVDIARGLNPDNVPSRFVGSSDGDTPCKLLDDEKTARGPNSDSVPPSIGGSSKREEPSLPTDASHQNSDYVPPNATESRGEEQDALSNVDQMVNKARGPNPDYAIASIGSCSNRLELSSAIKAAYPNPDYVPPSVGRSTGEDQDASSKSDHNLKMARGLNPDYVPPSIDRIRTGQEPSFAIRAAGPNPNYVPPSVGGSRGVSPVDSSNAFKNSKRDQLSLAPKAAVPNPDYVPPYVGGSRREEPSVAKVNMVRAPTLQAIAEAAAEAQQKGEAQIAARYKRQDQEDIAKFKALEKVASVVSAAKRKADKEAIAFAKFRADQVAQWRADEENDAAVRRKVDEAAAVAKVPKPKPQVPMSEAHVFLSLTWRGAFFVFLALGIHAALAPRADKDDGRNR